VIFVADFRLLSRRYKAKFAVPCGKEARLQSKYLALCEKFGESLVLSAFDQFAIANSWRKNPPPTLYLFFSECEQWIDDVREDLEASKHTDKKRQSEEQAMIADRAASRARVEKELEQRKREKEAIKRLPPNVF